MLTRSASAHRARCVRSKVGRVFAAAVFAASMLAASGSVAQVTVQGSEVTLRWAHAAGAVWGYQVFLSRNGGEMVDLGVIGTNEVKITGQPGEIVQITVRAFGFPNGPTQGFEWGPASELSDPIRFAGTDHRARRLPAARLRELPAPRASPTRAGSWSSSRRSHPTRGAGTSWEPGRSSTGNGHALLRERASGTLMIGLLSGNILAPVSSSVAPGFAAMKVSRPADLDADGVGQFLMHDPATGAVKIWGLEDGMLMELSRCDVQPGWRLIGFGDVDGDGQLDAWFDAVQGNVVVIHLRNLEAVTSTFIGNPVSSASSAVDVADYDGDGRADLLRRNGSSGAMHVSLMRGSYSSPTQDVRALAVQSGDSNVVPRGSKDIDGRPGADIASRTRAPVPWTSRIRSIRWRAAASAWRMRARTGSSSRSSNAHPGITSSVLAATNPGGVSSRARPRGAGRAGGLGCHYSRRGVRCGLAPAPPAAVESLDVRELLRAPRAALRPDPRPALPLAVRDAPGRLCGALLRHHAPQGLPAPHRRGRRRQDDAAARGARPDPAADRGRAGDEHRRPRRRSTSSS